MHAVYLVFSLASPSKPLAAAMQAPETGTTIVAVSFNGGVVLGADSRVSMGQYISNRASNKIAELAENTFLLRSGSAADCQAVSDYGAGLAALYVGFPAQSHRPTLLHTLQCATSAPSMQRS